MKTRAVVFPAAFKVAIDQIDLPHAGPGQVLTRTHLTGVSTGTETRVWSGKQPGGIFPLIPGYENLGEVIEAGEGVDLLPGTRVFIPGSVFTGPYNRMWGGQVEHALASAADVVPIPAGITDLEALYTKTAAIALHGILRAQVRAGETVAVVGQGLIGYLAAQAAKAHGARVIAIDPIAARLEMAQAAGIDITLNPEETDVKAKVKEITGGGVDVAVDVTGVAATIDGTMRLLPEKPWAPPYPPSGRLVILGSYVDPISFQYSPGLFEIEPDILVSRDCLRSDMLEVLNLFQQKKMDTSRITADILPFSQAEQGYRALVAREATRVIFQWE